MINNYRICIIDDFIDNKSCENIHDLFQNNFFPWFMFDSSITPEYASSIPGVDINKFVNSPVMRHAFILEDGIKSESIDVINPILKRIGQELKSDIQVERVQANLLFPNSEWIGLKNYPHIDLDYDETTLKNRRTYTGIFYVNDCDGDTIVYDPDDINKVTDVITPKKNRFAFWDSGLYHSSPASGSEVRYVINFNFHTPK